MVIHKSKTLVNAPEKKPVKGQFRKKHQMRLIQFFASFFATFFIFSTFFWLFWKSAQKSESVIRVAACSCSAFNMQQQQRQQQLVAAWCGMCSRSASACACAVKLATRLLSKRAASVDQFRNFARKVYTIWKRSID